MVPSYRNQSVDLHCKSIGWGQLVVKRLTFYQIVEQFELIQEIILPGVSKLNDSVLDKIQGQSSQFYPKRILEKRKMHFIFAVTFDIIQIDGLCYRVIHSSILTH